MEKTEAFDFVKFRVPRVMKFGENWSIWFLWCFVCPGSWKLEKIEVFDICEVSSTRDHENWRKLKYFNFLRFSWPRVHKTSQKSNTLIFSNFHDPGYMKVKKNQMLQFPPIFMTPRVHKINKKQMLQFPPNFMTPGTRNFTKIKCFNFLKLSWPRVHKTSQKSNTSIFSNFHDPGYTKLHKNQMLQYSLIFMTPGTRNLTKIRFFNFLWFSWPRVDKTSQKSNASIFSNFHEPG